MKRNARKIAVRAAAYRRRTAKHRRAYNKAYYQANKWRYKDQKHRRRSRERGGNPKDCAAFILTESKKKTHRCYYCKRRFGGVFHTDHVIPIAGRGVNGEHAPSNLCVSCPKCNFGKSNKLPSEISSAQPLLNV